MLPATQKSSFCFIQDFYEAQEWCWRQKKKKRMSPVSSYSPACLFIQNMSKCCTPPSSQYRFWLACGQYHPFSSSFILVLSSALHSCQTPGKTDAPFQSPSRREILPECSQALLPRPITDHAYILFYVLYLLILRLSSSYRIPPGYNVMVPSIMSLWNMPLKLLLCPVINSHNA